MLIWLFSVTVMHILSMFENDIELCCENLKTSTTLKYDNIYKFFHGLKEKNLPLTAWYCRIVLSFAAYIL